MYTNTQIRIVKTRVNEFLKTRETVIIFFIFVNKKKLKKIKSSKIGKMNYTII